VKRNKVQRELKAFWCRFFDIREEDYEKLILMEGNTRMIKDQSIVKSPVHRASTSTEIVKQVIEELNFDDDGDECMPVPCDDRMFETQTATISGGVPRPLQSIAEDIAEQRYKELVAVKFADQIKIDFIRSIDYRILCRFLGVTSVNDIKNHPYQAHPLITLILMECMVKFMEEEGFSFAGELNFDDHGNSIPPEKNPWSVKGKETTFTTTGFLYFEKVKGKKQENVAFFLYFDGERGGASITCFSTDTGCSKNIINDLQEFAKKHNCLRGAKLKDVNMISASFSEVEIKDSYTWDNYYYPESIKDLFDLEIFGFVKNVKKYNACGITKRGIILHGRAGTGKTTIGNIICNLVPDYTVIWITPEILAENNYKAITSIKALYKLADFLSPCIIILEDLDLFSQDREKGGDVISLGALMNILDGVNSIKNSVTIGTTNRLRIIESALKNRPGRFDRVVEVPALCEELRQRMFKDRLKQWKTNKKTLDHIVSKTDGWTGAEAQEFINSLNLKHISSRRKVKRIDIKWADEIIETMEKFGVGETSSAFGFGKRE